MKRLFAFIITILLICSALAPAALAENEPPTPTDTVTTTAITPESPSAIVLCSFEEPDRTDAAAFAVGSSQEELSGWFADSVAGFTGYDAEGNPYDLISGEWSLDSVDTGKVGVQYASALPNLGTEYTLADGVSLPRQLCAVSIQALGKPDINCCVSGRGFLRFPWVLSAEQQEQLDEFSVLLRKDTGNWTSLSAGFCFTAADLQLSQRILESGSTYALKVTYPGGQTGVLSFRYDGALSIIDYSGGDRDGGDVKGGGKVTGAQPAPLPAQTTISQKPETQSSNTSIPVQNEVSSAPNESSAGSIFLPQRSFEPLAVSGEPQETKNPVTEKTPPEEPAVPEVQTFVPPAASTESAPGNPAVPQPEHSVKSVPVSDGTRTPPKETTTTTPPPAAFESYSPTQTVISGLRLRDLCADEESVVFGSGDLTVSIPSKLLSALNLPDTEFLSVTLTQSEKYQIQLAVKASEKSVTELSGTVLRLRYRPQLKDAQLIVQNEAGEQIPDAIFDGELLRFTVNTAGVYTIVEIPKAKDASKEMSPLVPVSGGLILAMGGMSLFRRRHHG